MALREEITALQQRIRQIHATLEDIEAQADRLPSLPIDSLSRHFNALEDDLEETLSQLCQSREQVQDLGTRWGGATFTPAGSGKRGVNVVGKAIATAQVATSMVTGIATQATKIVVPPLQDVAVPTLELKDRLSPPNAEAIEKNIKEGKSLEDKSLKDLQSHYEISEGDKYKERSGSAKQKKKKS